MSFASRFNKYSSPFNLNSSGFPFLKLSECYEYFGPHKTYRIGVIFINKNNPYGASPVCAVTDGFNVNLPARLLADCTEMINDEEVIAAINKGLCGFKINEFERKGKKCYGVTWLDLPPQE